jgi:ribose transport system ATP-binding protein
MSTDMQVSQKPLLEVQAISKSFGPVQAVKNVSLSVSVGKVLGLVGENGAGKSTLLSLMSGTLTPDTGTLSINGKETVLHSYQDATSKGIFRIYQHQALVPNLSVAANLYLSQEQKFSHYGVLDDATMNKRAHDIFEELGITGIKPKDLIGDYSFAERQVVEIVRSFAQAQLLGIEHPIILHDEPTSALSRDQIEFFFEFVHKVKTRSAQIFVSHRLHEITELSDSILILKDGAAVQYESDASKISEEQIHEFMVGSKRNDARKQFVAGFSSNQPPLLSLKNFSGDGFEDVSFEVRPGEIVGFAGVVGSGKSELARAIFDAGLNSKGEITINSKPMKKGGPRESIRTGLGYVPGERHLEGIIEVLSVTRNLSLPAVGAALGSYIVNTKAENFNVIAAIKKLNIKTLSGSTLIRDLSGGNQQKVLLARWMTLDSKVLIFDNPTNGVDVGAKVEIYRIIQELAAEGACVLVMSDDLSEITTLANRIFVMKDGKIVLGLDVNPLSPPSEVEIVRQIV